MRKFKKEERGGFRYWFAHLCAYNMIAILHNMWKFKYLFHDIEKPWLMLFWKDYHKVQQYHRTHNRHHLEYKGGIIDVDIEATLIDWECSRYTKENEQLTARETLNREINKSSGLRKKYLKEFFTPILNKYDFE